MSTLPGERGYCQGLESFEDIFWAHCLVMGKSKTMRCGEWQHVKCPSFVEVVGWRSGAGMATNVLIAWFGRVGIDCRAV